MDKPSGSVDIVEVSSEERVREVRELLEEYWRTFAFDPCFQGFADELADLLGEYGAPAGRLALAIADAGQPGECVAGCIALRPLSARCCEMKRLYVRDTFRNRGVGAALVVWLIAQARAIGYDEMFLDTMPSMTGAIALYERLGFERCDAYADAPTDGALYFRRPLSAQVC